MSSAYCLLSGKYTTLAAITGRKQTLQDAGRGRTRCIDCRSWDLVLDRDGYSRRCRECQDKKAALVNSKNRARALVSHPERTRVSLVAK